MTYRLSVVCENLVHVKHKKTIFYIAHMSLSSFLLHIKNALCFTCISHTVINNSIYHVICSIYRAFCSICHVLCFIYHILCSIYHVLCFYFLFLFVMKYGEQLYTIFIKLINQPCIHWW